MKENILDQMGIQPFSDNDEDHAPANWGGERPGSGRPATGLRQLDITDIGIDIDGPAAYHADITVEACSCGRVGWEPYTVTVRGAWQGGPDDAGDHCPVIAEAEMPGQELKHKRGCINGGNHDRE